MADVHSPKIRSYNMSRIKGKNTKPELIVRKFLFSKGFRFRIHNKNLPGKPDIVLSRFKTVIFVNGCFWHGHKNCKYFNIPKTNTKWWISKIKKTRRLDIENYRKLMLHEWKVITIFECELRKGIREKTLNGIIQKLY